MRTQNETQLAEYPFPPHILVMEDESSVSQGLEMILTEEGYNVDVAATGRSALMTLENDGIDLLVADLRLPDIDGMDVVRHVRQNKPNTEVIIITGYGTAEIAVEAIMKLGVSDFLPKPFQDEEIKAAVGVALKDHMEKPVAPVIKKAKTEEEKLIQKREVIQVLNRSAEDTDFWTDLMETGSEALMDYELSMEAKAAIASGDLMWINKNVGELTQKQLMFIYKRLEREAW